MRRPAIREIPVQPRQLQTRHCRNPAVPPQKVSPTSDHLQTERLIIVQLGRGDVLPKRKGAGGVEEGFTCVGGEVEVLLISLVQQPLCFQAVGRNGN